MQNFEVDPYLMNKLLEVVLLGELIGDVIKAYSGVLKSLQGHVEVEVFDVKGSKLSTRLGEDTVDEEFDEFKGAGGCANITRVTDAIATYGDACAEGVILLWPVFTYHLGVHDLILAVRGNVMVVDDDEGICTQDTLAQDRGGAVEALA